MRFYQAEVELSRDKDLWLSPVVVEIYVGVGEKGSKVVHVTFLSSNVSEASNFVWEMHRSSDAKIFIRWRSKAGGLWEGFGDDCVLTQVTLGPPLKICVCCPGVREVRKDGL